ncbi:MAG TPA: adenylate/guanylate cyclase domain-containing protein, partial [Hyphomicrobiaceae bacterium]|nr:adenylate/guanylate cyclase domain-containing protein [Hyphomicrobiaceae bacterium]
RHVEGSAETELPFEKPRLQPGADGLIRRSADAVAATPFSHGLVARLAEFVKTGPDVEARRIRPLVLARKWGAPARHVIELCLQATRDNLLGMSWSLLCPRCQGAKAASTALDQLPQTAHCSSCNIEYGRDYTRNVELAFFPSTVVRTFEDGEFCLFGPMSTPHIVAQVTVKPGEVRRLDCPDRLPYGRYRARLLTPGPEIDIEYLDGGFPVLIVEDAAMATERSADETKLVFSNKSGHPQTFVLEQAQWSSEALTADQVFTLQGFRDLFDESILRPGDHLQVDQVTLMFIDLKGSTALYESVGDIAAYNLVRTFFALVGGAVRKHRGAIVKTVGDAINAAFSNPDDALACAIDVHQEIEEYNRMSEGQTVVAKTGIHAGRTIAVTLNNRLDYYGTSVNLAARLSDKSENGDIVVSKSMAELPSVSRRIHQLTSTTDQARMKGFDGDVGFVRITLGPGDRSTTTQSP